MVNATVEDFSKLKKSMDICTYGKGVYLTINTSLSGKVILNLKTGE
jgi:hypothetical protein